MRCTFFSINKENDKLDIQIEGLLDIIDNYIYFKDIDKEDLKTTPFDLWILDIVISKKDIICFLCVLIFYRYIFF